MRVPRVRIAGPAPTDAAAAEVRAGLLRREPTLPCKFFYDEDGSRLFEAITRLPEYYLTRAETSILRRVVPGIVDALRPTELAEIGAGIGAKTGLLLDAIASRGLLRRITLLDISPEALSISELDLRERYPAAAIDAITGDFITDLPLLGCADHRLLAFLGSTIGNLHPQDVPALLRAAGATLGHGSAFLLGVDLVKDRARLEAAYDDAQGVTARFNRNVLAVLNARLGTDFDTSAFEHVAFYDEQRAWVEMRLRARRPCVARVAGLEVAFEEGDEVRTEISCKYTRATLEARLAGTGLRIAEWHTDDEQLFALALLRADRLHP
jgi:L-histidine N-alpha-methyltransferase